MKRRKQIILGLVAIILVCLLIGVVITEKVITNNESESIIDIGKIVENSDLNDEAEEVDAEKDLGVNTEFLSEEERQIIERYPDIYDLRKQKESRDQIKDIKEVDLEKYVVEGEQFTAPFLYDPGYIEIFNDNYQIELDTVYATKGKDSNAGLMPIEQFKEMIYLKGNYNDIAFYISFKDLVPPIYMKAVPVKFIMIESENINAPETVGISSIYLYEGNAYSINVTIKNFEAVTFENYTNLINRIEYILNNFDEFAEKVKMH